MVSLSKNGIVRGNTKMRRTCGGYAPCYNRDESFKWALGIVALLQQIFAKAVCWFTKTLELGLWNVELRCKLSLQNGHIYQHFGPKVSVTCDLSLDGIYWKKNGKKIVKCEQFISSWVVRAKLEDFMSYRDNIERFQTIIVEVKYWQIYEDNNIIYPRKSLAWKLVRSDPGRTFLNRLKKRWAKLGAL